MSVHVSQLYNAFYKEFTENENGQCKVRLARRLHLLKKELEVELVDMDFSNIWCNTTDGELMFYEKNKKEEEEQKKSVDVKLEVEVEISVSAESYCQVDG